MSGTGKRGHNEVWDAIDREKGRDRVLRRIAVAGWSVAFFALLVVGVQAGMAALRALQAWGSSLVSSGEVFAVVLNELMPLVFVAGALSLLIATLATIGLFFRLRTASLAEIQLRLAALEEMLSEHRDGEEV